MATILFTAAMGAAGYTGTTLAVGQAFAALMGAIVDNKILLPAMFPQEDGEGPRVDDLQMQSAAEGTGLNIVMGDGARAAGAVMYVSDLRSVPDAGDAPESVGKGGGTPDVNSLLWKCDVAIQFATNEQEAIDYIWADGKPFYNNPNYSVTSSSVTATEKSGASGYPYKIEYAQIASGGLEDQTVVSNLTIGEPVVVSGYTRAGTLSPANALRVSSFTASTITIKDNGGALLSGTVLQGEVLTINGLEWGSYTIATASSQATLVINVKTNSVTGIAANDVVTLSGSGNGTHEVLETWINLSNGKHYCNVGSNWPITDRSVGSSITLAQTGLPTFPATRADDLDVYLGKLFQIQDPMLVAAKGSADTPSFVDKCYITITGLVQRDYGNRLPNFTARLKSVRGRTVGDAIAYICERAQIPASLYDVSDLSAVTNTGYVLRGRVGALQAILPLLVANRIVTQYRNGVLYFLRRSSVTQRTLDSSRLGTRAEGSDYDGTLRTIDVDESELPISVTVDFIDSTFDYQSGSITERAPYQGVWGEESSINLPLSMSPAGARNVALTALWDAYGSRHRYNGTLPPSYSDVRVGDRLNVTIEGRQHLILVERMDFGDNGEVGFEGRRDYSSLTDLFDETGDQKTFFTTPASVTPKVQAHFFDCAPLSESHFSVPGIYVSIASSQPGKWNGCSLYESTDYGVTFSKRQSITQQAVVGQCQTTLGSSDPFVWDRANTLTIWLPNGSLESVSEIACLNGANRAVVGGEVIGFQTATLIEDKTYEISTLLRGLRGTEEHVGIHGANETFSLLNNRVTFLPTSYGQIDVVRKYRPVGGGMAIDDAIETSARVRGWTARPMPVCHVAGTRDGSNDLTVTWVRRSRHLVRLMTEVSVPLDDGVESYEVDFLLSGVVKRTKTVSSATVEYTAAEQTTDGITPGDPVDVAIYMMSPTLGRGRVKEATV